MGILMTKYMKSAHEQVKLVTQVNKRAVIVSSSADASLSMQCMFRIVDQTARKSLIAMLSPEAQVWNRLANNSVNPL